MGQKVRLGILIDRAHCHWYPIYNLFFNIGTDTDIVRSVYILFKVNFKYKHKKTTKYAKETSSS